MKPWTANQRVIELFNETDRLGLDDPTAEMIEDAIRDAEYNALYHPIEIARQHDQETRMMCNVWANALLESLPETFPTKPLDTTRNAFDTDAT